MSEDTAPANDPMFTDDAAPASPSPAPDPMETLKSRLQEYARGKAQAEGNLTRALAAVEKCKADVAMYDGATQAVARLIQETTNGTA